MRCYENIFIVRQELSPSQVQTVSDAFSKVVKDAGGELVKSEYCGLRHLAYPIQKNKSGHYVLFGIKSKPDVITELERKMRLNEDVIRFLTINVDEIDENPSVLMQQSRQRDSYYGDRDSDRKKSYDRSDRQDGSEKKDTKESADV